MRLRARIRHSRIYIRNKWTPNLQAASLWDYQHGIRPPHWEPTTIKRAPHATGASSLPHQLRRKPGHKISAKRTYEYPACAPRNGLASSPHQRLVSSSPFSMWVSRTFDNPQQKCTLPPWTLRVLSYTVAKIYYNRDNERSGLLEFWLTASDIENPIEICWWSSLNNYWRLQQKEDTLWVTVPISSIRKPWIVTRL
jgi:hypothetical protein